MSYVSVIINNFQKCFYWHIYPNCSRPSLLSTANRSQRKFEFFFALAQSLSKKAKIYKIIWFTFAAAQGRRKMIQISKGGELLRMLGACSYMKDFSFFNLVFLHFSALSFNTGIPANCCESHTLYHCRFYKKFRDRTSK